MVTPTHIRSKGEGESSNCIFPVLKYIPVTCDPLRADCYGLSLVPVEKRWQAIQSSFLSERTASLCCGTTSDCSNGMQSRYWMTGDRGLSSNARRMVAAPQPSKWSLWRIQKSSVRLGVSAETNTLKNCRSRSVDIGIHGEYCLADPHRLMVHLALQTFKKACCESNKRISDVYFALAETLQETISGNVDRDV